MSSDARLCFSDLTQHNSSSSVFPRRPLNMKQHRFCLVQGSFFTLSFVKCDGQCVAYMGTQDCELCTALTAFRLEERGRKQQPLPSPGILLVA